MLKKKKKTTKTKIRAWDVDDISIDDLLRDYDFGL